MHFAQHALLLLLAYDAGVGLSGSILGYWLNVLLFKVNLSILLDFDDFFILVYWLALLPSSQPLACLAILATLNC